MSRTSQNVNTENYNVLVRSGFKLDSINLGDHATQFQLGKDFPPVIYSAIGSAKELRLPLAAPAIAGLTFFIRNISGGANTLTVATSVGGAVQTLAQNAAGVFHCDGATWRTIAL